MIQVDLASLALDSRGEPVVILKPISQDEGQAYVLPIWIGPQEATAIMLAVQGATASRPLAYDLMVRLLDALEGSVVQVAVTRLKHGTFFAEIELDTPTGRRVVDARPSDSIALAMRTTAPIFVSEDVMLEAGIAETQVSEADEESQVEEFSHFLDTVNPDDFRG